MRVAITGATGFVGGHLAERLSGEGHEVVRIGRLDSLDELAKNFSGCKTVAHCAGINREIGDRTFAGVHIDATRNVVEAARRAGVEKIVLMSFLRARPDCGSPYHESKWAAEEIVRNSGLDYTIVKAGVVYGRGDHMLDHLSHAFHTFPVFGLVGFKEMTVRPLAIEDLVHVMRASLIDRRIKQQTIALVGPEEIYLSEAVKRVADVVGKHPLMLPLPICIHQLLARVFERTMKIPLVSQAQIRILSEGVSEPAGKVSPVPYDLIPTRRFTPEQIRNGLPHPAPFCVGDLRLCS